MKKNWLIYVGGVLLIMALLCWLFALPTDWSGWLAVAGLLAVALGFQQVPALKGLTYTTVIFAAVVASLFFPHLFLGTADFKTTTLITPLLQIIMFGMGTTMSLKDFVGVVRMPKGVLVGIVCQFSIMPILGWVLAKSFSFEPEVAAGIILVGCSPSGLASNVMCYIARANVALSITLTSVATLMAPIMTPFLMQQLGGQLVPIDFQKMMMDIIYMVIVPIVLGLVVNRLLSKRTKVLDIVMPLVSMAGIAVIITIITASGRDNLLTIGGVLIMACFLHNTIGYILGYWASRLLRMPEQDCRTIALEVGLQNGGLASALAAKIGNLATIGLAPAVFGPLMNITGSALANWWRERPLSHEK